MRSQIVECIKKLETPGNDKEVKNILQELLTNYDRVPLVKLVTIANQQAAKSIIADVIYTHPDDKARDLVPIIEHKFSIQMPK